MNTDLASEARGPAVEAGERAGVDASDGPVSSVRAVLLLAGATRKLGLAEALGRSPLDLPVTDDRRILDLWLERLMEVGLDLGIEGLSVRVLVNELVPTPVLRGPSRGLSLTVEQDRLELRGTAGLLRDACSAYGDDAWVLVANAGQILVSSLIEPVRRLMGSRGEVRLLRHEDGTPASLFLIRCGALRSVARQGYIDLKEQFLPRLGERSAVMTVDSPAISVPVRTVSDYIEGLQAYHREGPLSGLSEPYAEDWRSSFAVVEAGAEVDETARLHDSVVLKGGRVGAGATLVRSVVCSAGHVGPRRTQRDAVVGGGRRSRLATAGDSGLRGRGHGLRSDK
ncbi:hypothetical protein [Mucisphaera sp.]|uniref:hypothetical protein n=1 Tax=Mucisphaera sp. TaxID=2913024 RepID=UPI003D09ABE5